MTKKDLIEILQNYEDDEKVLIGVYGKDLAPHFYGDLEYLIGDVSDDGYIDFRVNLPQDMKVRYDKIVNITN